MSLAQLRDEIDTLQEEVRQLREALAPQIEFPRAWRLTATESRVLSALIAATTTRSQDRLMTAVYGAGWDEDPKIIDVMICKIRKKIPAPTWIETVRGEGFRLSAAGRRAIHAELTPFATETEEIDMAKQTGGTPGRKQLNIAIDPKVHDRLQAMANAAGMSLSTYARTLLEAAYSARCGATGDRDLDATVAAALILSGADLDTDEVARALKTNEAVVVRILDAWRDARPAGELAAA